MNEHTYLNNIESNSNGLSALLIHHDQITANAWFDALRNSGLSINADILNSVSQFISYENLKPYTLIIYHSREFDDEISDFFNHAKKINNDIPILIASDFPSTELYTEYSTAGAIDIFQTNDLDRLALIANREIKTFNIKKALLEVKQQFTESEARCQTLIENAEEAIAYIQDGMHMHVNPSYMAIFGYIDEEELTIKPIMDLISDNNKTDFKKFLRSAGKIIHKQTIQLNCIRANNEVFEAALTFSPAIFDDENCIQVQVENLELQNKVRLVSEKDPHTGLYNRHHFTEDLKIYFNQKDPQTTDIYLLYIVVDGFEEMKNKYGLMGSDSILREISIVIQKHMKTEMNLYRFGDHSFTILLQSRNEKLAPSIAETLINIVSQHHYERVDNAIPPTLSIGISHASKISLGEIPDRNLPDELLNRAYQACHEIFTHAGNGYIIYQNSDSKAGDLNIIEAVDDTVHLKELLNHALEYDRFKLSYQPIVSIHGNTRETYSVLLRLLDNENQEIRPIHFVKQAMEYGLMAKVDRWVINAAIEEIASQRRAGSRINFYIQLSASAIQDDTLLLWVVDCIRNSSAKGDWVTFQFHYLDLFDHFKQAEKLILGLKKINCNIAINKFIDNQESEALISRLPIDSIKISSSLVDNIKNDEDQREQLTNLNNKIQTMKIETIVTKIEDAETLSLLWFMGVNYTQGAFLLEPSPLID